MYNVYVKEIFKKEFKGGFMKLIVGLGNPGKEYVGFIYLDNYAKENGFSINKEKFNGNFWEITKNGEKVIFLKPLSYMNLSGIVVRKYLDYYKIDLSDVLIIHDDLDMEMGRIKIKNNGSCGGHNGIRNIIEQTGSQKFMRLKVGISKNSNLDTKDYVLGKFNKEEKEIIDKKLNVVNNIIDDFINDVSPEIIMGRYNGVNNENI